MEIIWFNIRTPTGQNSLFKKFVSMHAHRWCEYTYQATTITALLIVHCKETDVNSTNRHHMYNITYHTSELIVVLSYLLNQKAKGENSFVLVLLTAMANV